MINIITPGLLAGGTGQAMQQLGSDIRSAATQIGGVVNRIAEQQDYVKATRAEGAMLAEKQKNLDDFLRVNDGTDPEAYKKFIAADEAIGQKYMKDDDGKFGLGPSGRRFLELKHVESQQRHGVHVQKYLDDALLKSSQVTTGARVDNEIRSAVSTGEFQLGLQNVAALIESQRGYYGDANTDALKKAEIARYAETWMKTSLADRTTSKMMVKRMDDPVQKKLFYSFIKAEKIDEMEKLVETTRMHNYARDKEEKEAQYEDSLATIMDGIIKAQETVDANGRPDPQLREFAYQNGIKIINEGLAQRIFRGSDVGKLYKTLQDFRAGKLQETDAYYAAQVWADIGDGRKSIREVLTDEKIAANDKIGMFKFIVNERNQDRRAAMTAGAMARAVTRQNFGDMVKFAHPTGPTAPMQMGNFNAFSRDAAQAVSKGSDPWTFYYENYNKYFPTSMPTISVPGMGVVTPRSYEDINKVVKWIPQIKDTKTANMVADQVEQAKRLMKIRDYNATQKGADGERKTKP